MTSVRPVDNHLIEDAAARLADAERAGDPCTPVRNLFGRNDIDTDYRVQTLNVDAAVADGQRGLADGHEELIPDFALDLAALQ